MVHRNHHCFSFKNSLDRPACLSIGLETNVSFLVWLTFLIFTEVTVQTAKSQLYIYIFISCRLSSRNLLVVQNVEFATAFMLATLAGAVLAWHGYFLLKVLDTLCFQ